MDIMLADTQHGRFERESRKRLVGHEAKQLQDALQEVRHSLPPFYEAQIVLTKPVSFSVASQ
jgi:hypothetical protein